MGTINQTDIKTVNGDKDIAVNYYCSSTEKYNVSVKMVCMHTWSDYNEEF